MPPLFKKIAAIILSLFALFLVYYGSYLPMRKSQLFIEVMRGVGNTASLKELKEKFSIPLDSPSPVGQEELVRNTANFITGSFQQPNLKTEVALDLLKYIEEYYFPIIESGRSAGHTQNLYILGILNELVYTRTGSPEYLEAAEKYFSEGLTISPNRPQFLFGMFDIYHLKGDIEGMKRVNSQIASLWPEGTETNQAMQSVIERLEGSKPPGS